MFLNTISIYFYIYQVSIILPNIGNAMLTFKFGDISLPINFRIKNLRI